jgi:hypothetical protein
MRKVLIGLSTFFVVIGLLDLILDRGDKISLWFLGFGIAGIGYAAFNRR